MLNAATVLMEVTASEATASACVRAERSLCCAPVWSKEGRQGGAGEVRLESVGRLVTTPWTGDCTSNR